MTVSNYYGSLIPSEVINIPVIGQYSELLTTLNYQLFYSNELGQNVFPLYDVNGNYIHAIHTFTNSLSDFFILLYDGKNVLINADRLYPEQLSEQQKILYNSSPYIGFPRDSNGLEYKISFNDIYEAYNFQRLNGWAVYCRFPFKSDFNFYTLFVGFLGFPCCDLDYSPIVRLLGGA